MELSKIENLLEKYFDGETSLAEEAVLKEYFSRPDVPSHLEPYRGMFGYFNQSGTEVAEKEIVLPQRNHLIQWLSIAAALILMISMFTVYEKNEREKQEARLAYIETTKALNMISQNLNKGNKAIVKLETFNQTRNKIFKNNK
jgi:ABC-type nitrate/sulfonate/bicarbonate transport system ATPase subunit